MRTPRRSRSVQSGNEPIVGATVRLLELDREQRTDAQGQFSFSNVPKGTYRIYAGGILGYVAATDTVQVSGGEVSVSFKLVASAIPLQQIVISGSPTHVPPMSSTSPSSPSRGSSWTTARG